MQCKFIQHGLAISYNQVVKPCCHWSLDDDWKQQNHINHTNLGTWHQSAKVQHAAHRLEQGIWPKNCNKCATMESQGRYDSMRGNGNHAYAHYNSDDITLEIRPGNICNFACQTCWPEASSRVTQYQHAAGLINAKDIDSVAISDFQFLVPIKHRIKDVVLLGGEPFYDKNCRRFLSWALDNLQGNIMMFTNGSCIDYEFLQKFNGKICLIFSLDAVGSAAEYIRFGTVWEDVLQNYKMCKTLSNVEIRVNVTCSIYNYVYMDDLMELLCDWWPSVVSFGVTHQPWFLESAVPLDYRQAAVESLSRSLARIHDSNVEPDQQHNAVNALNSIIRNLETTAWNSERYQQLKNYVEKMDKAKKISVADHCPWLASMLQIKV